MSVVPSDNPHINSPFNACQHRDYCKGNTARIEQLERELAEEQNMAGLLLSDHQLVKRELADLKACVRGLHWLETAMMTSTDKAHLASLMEKVKE